MYKESCSQISNYPVRVGISSESGSELVRPAPALLIPKVLRGPVLGAAEHHRKIRRVVDVKLVDHLDILRTEAVLSLLAHIESVLVRVAHRLLFYPVHFLGLVGATPAARRGSPALVAFSVKGSGWMIN